MSADKTPQHSGRWAETVENLGCGLLVVVLLLGAFLICMWGAVSGR